MGGLLIFLIIIIGSPLFLIILNIHIENKMLAQVAKDEKDVEAIRIFNLKTVPANYETNGCRTQMVTGSITIAGSYFTHFLSSWRNLFGGEMKSYKKLLEIAKRYAMVRMKREAAAMNASCIINIRYSTSNILMNSGNQGMSSIEVLVYGTAVIPN